MSTIEEWREPLTMIEVSVAQAILAGESDAIVATDRDGQIAFWNPGAVRIFGFTREEALGRSLDMIIPENLRPRHWEGYRKVMETGESRYGRGDVLSVPALTKEGRRISVDFTVVLLRGDDGRPEGVAAIMRDATKRYEELKALRAQARSAPKG